MRSRRAIPSRTGPLEHRRKAPFSFRHPVSASVPIIAAFLQIAGLVLPAAAFESDPYLALRVELADAAPAINEFLNSEIEEAVDQINAEATIERCEAMPGKIFSHLFSNLLSSRLKRFLEHSPRIERFPEDDLGYWQYLRASIYRRPIFPYIVPMSSIIEVGGVRVGVDKFGHMLGEGRRYYRIYRRGLAKGRAREDAERRAILRRLRWERILLGGWADGVLSFADLEANYQGLKLARAMCEGPAPYLVRRAGAWSIRRPIQIEDFVVPALDESFYPNRFLRGRWKRVRPILESEHCSLLARPEVQARFERYRQTDQLNLSRQFVEEHFAERGIPLESHSLQAVCASKEAGEISASDGS